MVSHGRLDIEHLFIQNRRFDFTFFFFKERSFFKKNEKALRCGEIYESLLFFLTNNSDFHHLSLVNLVLMPTYCAYKQEDSITDGDYAYRE